MKILLDSNVFVRWMANAPLPRGVQRAGRTSCGIKDLGNNARLGRAARSHAVSGERLLSRARQYL